MIGDLSSVDLATLKRQVQAAQEELQRKQSELARLAKAIETIEETAGTVIESLGSGVVESLRGSIAKGRFSDSTLPDALDIVLREKGGWTTRNEAIKELLSGGLRSSDLRASLNTAVHRHEKFARHPSDTNLIGLAEWLQTAKYSAAPPPQEGLTLKEKVRNAVQRQADVFTAPDICEELVSKRLLDASSKRARYSVADILSRFTAEGILERVEQGRGTRPSIYKHKGGSKQEISRI